MQDKRNNPSNYSLVILSEGAEWQGYAVKEYGEADAFGHRKKMSVAEDLSDEIKRTTGEETVVSDLTYDLRSGSPDFVDRLVAFTFAGMAMDALEEGKSGLMTAINEGRYAMVPIPDPKLGPRKVDIASMYNTDRYRPIAGDYARSGRSSPGEMDDEGRSHSKWAEDEYRGTSRAGSANWSDRSREDRSERSRQDRFDPHYRSWRDRHLDELDRDYDD